MEIPKYSKDLIKMLDTLYPEKTPSIDDTPKSIWFNSGKRDLVRALVVALAQEEEENPLFNL